LQRARPDVFTVGTIVLVVATVATRLPFMTHTLYAFDSANYALAVRDFYNVAFHQPHPPGYPLYVFFAKVLNLVVHDANRALILEGIVWSAVAVGCTTLLARALFGRTVGLLAGVLLFATVGFWGYAEVAYPYVALSRETSALALLAHEVIAGNRTFLALRRRFRPRSGQATGGLGGRLEEGTGWLILPLAVVWAISLGVRWDGAVFCLPLALWALYTVSWRLRLISAALTIVIAAAFAVPMIALTGGWDVYRQAIDDYLKVWSPQSAYVVGDFASGGDTQATYNLNFLVNYLRQMLGVGLLLVLYLFGRRFAPSALAADYRGRFLALWAVPPLVVYVFAHLGEPGYVLSLAPAAATLIALAIVDLRDEFTTAARVLRARGWRYLPSPRVVGSGVGALLTLGIVGWNVQAFARGVGPGRLPDLKAHDLTTQMQIDYIQHQDVQSTFVLSHDIFRQLHYYVPEYHADLLFSEYVPDFQTALTRTNLPAGTSEIVILDGPLKVAPEDASLINEVRLNEQPRVSVWLVNAAGAIAVEHGYQAVRLIR
jgi:hypothetical protein